MTNRKEHWETINRILDTGTVTNAIKTHLDMRHDVQPCLDFLALGVAISMVMPKKYRGKTRKADCNMRSDINEATGSVINQ